MNRHQIQVGIQLHQRLRGGVDHHHIVFILAKFFRQMGAGLAATNDQNSHESIRFLQLLTIIQILPPLAREKNLRPTHGAHP